MTNQDGFGSCGHICPNPVNLANMSLYASFPLNSDSFAGGVFDGHYIWPIPRSTSAVRLNRMDGSATTFIWPGNRSVGSSAFGGGAFDGSNVWFAPRTADAVVKIDRTSGAMTLYMAWPSGLALGSAAFAGAVFAGGLLWLVPHTASGVVVLNRTDGSMTMLSEWPAGSNVGNAKFFGGISDGTFVWLAPFEADGVLRIEIASSAMTYFKAWPANLTRGTTAFAGAVFDGRYVWLVAHGADGLVKVDPTSGSMTLHNAWPSGLSRGLNAFYGGIFDGWNIWLIPFGASGVVKVDPSTGSMTLVPYQISLDRSTFAGGVFDGSDIWLMPFNADGVVRLQSKNAPTATESALHSSTLSFSHQEASASASLTRTSASATQTRTEMSDTFSSSCELSPVVLANVTLLTTSSGSSGKSLLFDPAGSSLLVTDLLAATSIEIIISSGNSVAITSAGNVSGNIGSGWAASVQTASVGGTSNTTMITVSGLTGRELAGTLSLVEATPLIVEVDVRAIGRCLPPAFRIRARFLWTLRPTLPPSDLRVATTSVFRISSITSSFLGNPITAMSTTGMISILSLSECLYSDVDPLDPSVSPLGVGMGPAMGQYYRGGAAIALLLYASISTVAVVAAAVLSSRNKSPLSTSLATLHFPSIGMVAVGMFGQGLASCGMSLIRLDWSTGDVLLGIAALVTCAFLAVGVLYVTTRGLESQMTEIIKEKVADSAVVRLAEPFVKLATWNMHWIDRTPTSLFKRRYMMLIDDLRLPWWTAVELSSCLLQGAVLGIRDNSASVCRMQQWILTVHAAMIAGAAIYFRPCGAYLSNMFLILLKVGALAVAFMLLLQAFTLDDVFDSAAQIVTTISTAIGSCQTLVQVLLILLRLPRLLPKLRRKLLDMLTTSKSRGLQEIIEPSDDATNDVRLDTWPQAVVAALDNRRTPIAPRMIEANAEESPPREDQMMPEVRKIQAAVGRRHVQLKFVIAASHPATTQRDRLALLVRAACQESIKTTSGSRDLVE